MTINDHQTTTYFQEYMEIMEYYAVNNGQNNTELGLKWCKGDLSLVLRTRRSGVRIPSGVPHIKSLKPMI